MAAAAGAPVDLVGPECPPELAHVMGWFLDLSSTRLPGFGLAPILYGEIRAWAELMGVTPTPFEVSVLRSLDRKLIEVMRG